MIIYKKLNGKIKDKICSILTKVLVHSNVQCIDINKELHK